LLLLQSKDTPGIIILHRSDVYNDGWLEGEYLPGQVTREKVLNISNNVTAQIGWFFGMFGPKFGQTSIKPTG
jgi:hypothetical protein